MLKRSVATLMAALLLAFLPTAANAVGGSGYFNSVGTVQLLSSGCFYVPYSAVINVDSGAESWQLETRILYPNGAVSDEGFDYGEGSGAHVVQEEMFFCSSIEPIGTYSMTGKLSVYDASYNKTEVVLTPSTFQVVRYTPPPAPPAPAPTPVTYQATAKLDLNVWFKRVTVARLGASFNIDYACTVCSDPERPIKIEGRLASGKWRTIATRSYQYSEYLKVKVPYKFRKVRVTAPTSKTDASTTYARVVSNKIRVPRPD